jgi:urease accessory protein
MTTDLRGLERLRLLQLASPALPVGAFSYSEGLEVLIQGGRLRGADDLEAWLRAELRRGLLPLEGAALRPLAAALDRWRQQPGPEAERAVRDLDDWLLLQREASELRAQQRQMGRSLLQLLAALGWPLPGGALDLAWPAAWAWAGLCGQLTPLASLEGYLSCWLANQLSAAVRLQPLGPSEAQRLQWQLAPLLAERAEELLAADPQDLWSGGIGAGLAQLGHGGLYSRLFRS